MENNGKKKMGRPTTDRKGKRFELRLSENTFEKLEECARILGISKADVIHKGIEMIYQEAHKNQDSKE